MSCPRIEVKDKKEQLFIGGRFLLQVTGHCFTNTESIPDTCKS